MDARADIRDLIDAARLGAPDAIGRIFEAARGHLLKLADQELPGELRAKVAPSDLVQETALDAQRDFTQFSGTTSEECFAWLRQILHHNVIDAVRHYRNSLKRDIDREVQFVGRPVEDHAALVAGQRPPDGSAIRREEAAMVVEVLERLPIDYRRVLQMRYWSGMSFVEMAPALDRSPEAVRKLWYRALERLQDELSPATVGAAIGHAATGAAIARARD